MGCNIEKYKEHLELFKEEANYSFCNIFKSFNRWEKSFLRKGLLSLYFSTDSIKSMNKFKYLYDKLFLWRMAQEGNELGYICKKTLF